MRYWFQLPLQSSYLAWWYAARAELLDALPKYLKDAMRNMKRDLDNLIRIMEELHIENGQLCEKLQDCLK